MGGFRRFRAPREIEASQLKRQLTAVSFADAPGEMVRAHEKLETMVEERKNARALAKAAAHLSEAPQGQGASASGNSDVALQALIEEVEAQGEQIVQLSRQVTYLMLEFTEFMERAKRR